MFEFMASGFHSSRCCIRALYQDSDDEQLSGIFDGPETRNRRLALDSQRQLAIDS